MGKVAGIAGLPWCSLMAGATAGIRFLFVAGQAELFLIVFELEFTRRVVAIMTFETLSLKYRLVLTVYLWLVLLLALSLLASRPGIMAVETDHFSWFDKEQTLITCMDRMTADTLLVQIRFMNTSRAGLRLFMTVETQRVGRGLCDDLLLLYLVA